MHRFVISDTLRVFYCLIVLLVWTTPTRAEDLDLKELVKKFRAERAREAAEDARGDPSTFRMPTQEEKLQHVRMVRDQMADHLGISRESREMKQFLRLAEDSVYNREPDPVLFDEKRFDSSKPVIAHLKFKEGVALPSQEELDRIAENTVKAAAELYLSGLPSDLDLVTPQMKFMEEMEQPLAIPRCTTDAVEKVDFQDSSGLQEAAFKDFLFYEDEFPFDPKVMIGPRVVFHRYTQEKGDVLSAIFGRIGIPCLPFRIRNMGRIVYYYTGAKAFINFDKDPLGEGKLDPTVEAYLTQQKASGG